MSQAFSDPDVIVANSLSPVSNGSIWLTVINLDNREILLKEGQQVATVREVLTTSDATNDTILSN
jgi:hypothetical protein